LPAVCCWRFWLHSRMEVVEFGRLTDAQRAELEGDEHDPFDAEGTTLRFRPKDHHVALRDDRGRLIASAGLLTTEVEVAREHFTAVGLGGAIVNAECRGRGLARRVVQESLDRARTMGPAFVILFCHGDRVGLYERLGFSKVGSPVSVRQPDGFADMPQHMMWYPLHPQASWPTGIVIVHDLPF
jgi:predicted N-acetyltransferase YhbS